MSDVRYDVVVVGGGHAGCEAAHAAARMGARVALVTHSRDTIGTMSCNPAIGGIGKGHLVREIDALGGLMGIVADAAGIQFRVLNRRKGPAVWGPRTQADRRLYRETMQAQIAACPGLKVVEGDAADFILDDERRVQGVILSDGTRLACGAVVLTTGTFLGGLIHIGDQRIPAGRMGEAPSHGLAATLRGLGLTLGRLKTGTPARLDGRTIQWDKLDRQRPDADPMPFSFLTGRITNPQIDCGITRTTPETHRIIRENLHLSALYGGRIEGTGPRYCPSIEDKIVKFGDREGHQVFLEPEGLDDHTVYPNGLSTSLPEAVQHAFLRSMPGLEQVDILKPGYAIEYDHVDPHELDRGLSLRKARGLFLAGQINGTTGYEEAAAQGLVAGMNAALSAAGSEPFQFGRENSYIGVMVDDLTRNGVSEPYRMFTSRAEFRLSLRADNADLRLTPVAIRFGTATADRRQVFEASRNSLNKTRALLQSRSLTPGQATAKGLVVNQDGRSRTAWQLLSAGIAGLDQMTDIWPELAETDASIRDRIEIEALYDVYLERQRREQEALRRSEAVRIPDGFDYAAIRGLSNEVRAKLLSRRPRTIGEADRIDGMTPAAIAILLVALRRQGDALAA